MRTVLHIGMPKTGSTALQDCLRAARPALAARGVLYPENPPGCPFNNHRLLLFGFLAHRDLPRHVRKHRQYVPATIAAEYAAFRAHLAAEVAAARPEMLVLSSESLFRPLDARGRAALAAALAPFGPTTVAVYLRRPSDYYLSALQQRLKSAHSVTAPRVQSPLRVLAGYASAYGPAALAPRVYDRSLLAESDIVADFLAAYLPEAGLAAAALPHGRRTNETVSAEAMDLMRRFRLAFHADEEDVPSPAGTLLLRALGRADRALGAARPRLRPEIAEAIDYARPDALRLRDAYGLVFPGLDYDRLARVRPGRTLAPLLRGLWRPWRLEEVVAIDPAMRTALLERLARSRWAAADPARARWIAGLMRAPAAAA